MTQVVRELERLVAFPSVSSRPIDALASYVAERCESLGFRIERFADPVEPGKYNIVASAGPAGTDGMALSGHMDVVPTEGQPWSSDPFRVTERDGLLYGRGTADMKGFIAATLVALEQIRTRDLARELVLVWTYDEEVGCLGSGHLVHALRDEGRALPSLCLVGEPTDFRILRAHPGHVAVEIAIEGRAAHSSRPDLGVNAIEAASVVVGAIRELARELEIERAHEDLLERPWVAVNTARIRGGSAVNIVPDRCVIEVGYRPLPGMPVEQVYERLRERIDALVPQLGGAKVSLRIMRASPPLLTPSGTELEAILAPHASAPGTGAASFSTDGGNLARAGTQSLVFGPGSIEVAHKADEYIPADALVRAVGMVRDVVAQRCCR